MNFPGFQKHFKLSLDFLFVSIWFELCFFGSGIHFYPLGSQHIAARIPDLFQGSMYEVLTLVSTAVLSSLRFLPCLCYVLCCRFCDPNWLLQSFVSVTGDDPWQRLMVCSSRPHKLIRPTVPHNQMINPRDDDLNSFCIKCNEMSCRFGNSLSKPAGKKTDRSMGKKWPILRILLSSFFHSS